MNRTHWTWRIGLAASFLMLTAWAANAALLEKNNFNVRNGKLCRGDSVFTIRAMETPALGKPGLSGEDLARTLARVSEAGANTVCFDLRGFSADGATLAPETAAAIREMMEQAEWRRMGALCRIFAPDAPTGAAYRKAAVRAAAEALKSEARVVYWITGPDSAELAAEFRAIAPKPMIAAEQGGDLNVVSAMPAAAGEKPALVAGAITPPELRETVHFVLAGADADYAALDAAMANPAEGKPWTPDNSVLDEKERAEGWIALFNGKDLDGWSIIGPNKNGFVVKDGTIEWGGLGGVALYSRERYDNFTLRVEWKIRQKGNSGIYLHAPRANRQSKIGMEFQLQGDSGDPNVVDQTTGAVYDVVPPKVNAAKPEGEWNELEVTLNGPQLKAVLNGQLVQDVNFDDNPELRPRLRRGFIGLQDHACWVAFRNIRLKKL